MIVASYNVHRCVGLDGRQDVERVAAVIRELGADVVGLQEVAADASQLAVLASLSGLHAVAGPLWRWQDVPFGNALLSREAPRAVRLVDLTVGRREPRGAIDADLVIDRRALRVIVTHLGLLGHERRRQLRLLRDALGAAESAHPVVILADLNEWFGAARRLREVLDFAGPAVRSFPAWWPALALDRVLVRPGHLVKEVRAHASALACMASDHLPVRAELA
jgi:endonuclease/exonuclease/phosphatase family metal-dependent hydrolase